MTAAACQAIALEAALAVGEGNLASRFFRAAAKAIDAPWRLAVGSDLALANLPGPRPLATRVINAYIARLQRAAVHDAQISVAVIRVIHLVAAPVSLFAPRVFLRVMLRGSRRAANLALTLGP